MAGPTGGGPCDVENTPDPDACMRRLLQAIASGGPQEGSLLRRPDIAPSLNIFDAMHIYMDPDDNDGEFYANVDPFKPRENDCWRGLCTPGVVTMQTTPDGRSRDPNAIFLRPNTEFTINIGGNFGRSSFSPAIWSFFTWDGGPPDRGVPPNPWMWPPGDPVLITPVHIQPSEPQVPLPLTGPR
jgi:hypothetical protein